jgi:hypothetical protein
LRTDSPRERGFRLKSDTMAIDNRIEKVGDILNEDNDDLLDGLVRAGSVFSGWMAFYEAFKSIFDQRDARHRVKAAMCALCDEMESLRDALPGNLEASLKSEWFKRGLRVAIENAARESSEERAAALGVALAYGSFPDEENKHRQEDVASYIRDLSLLGTDDIQMLNLLRDTYWPVIKSHPNLNDAEVFRQHFNKFRQAATSLNIHTDDCVSTCARLSGFGLTIELPRGSANVQQSFEQYFRPTRRGLYLLSLLERAEARKVPATD